MMKRRSEGAALALMTLVSFATVAACGSKDGGSSTGGNGNVQIFVVPEDSIANGLEPGTELENVQDGWTITYDRYLVAVGNFRARRSDTGDSLSDPSVHILDLKLAPTSGYVVKELTGVSAVRWDKFGYDVPNAKAGATPVAPTTQADADFMIANGYSVYYEGSGTKGGKTITFKWGFAAGTAFDDCASPDGVPGFAVPAGGTVQLKPTLHGDHQYFDNVTQGVEITKRLAQWLETCDKDAKRRAHHRRAQEVRRRHGAPAAAVRPHRRQGSGRRRKDQRLRLREHPDAHVRRLPGRRRVSDPRAPVIR